MAAKPPKNKLKARRAMHDGTQKELGRRVEVTRKTMNTVENGRYAPSLFLARKIARAFDVPVEELLQLDE